MALLSNSFANFSVLSLSHAFYTVYLCILTISLTMIRRYLVFELQIFPIYKHLHEGYSYFLPISTEHSSNCFKVNHSEMDGIWSEMPISPKQKMVVGWASFLETRVEPICLLSRCFTGNITGPAPVHNTTENHPPYIPIIGNISADNSSDYCGLANLSPRTTTKIDCVWLRI